MHKNCTFLFLLFSVLSQEEQKPKRKKLETALLGKRAQFQCNVQSADASEVTLWWQFEGTNLTSSLLDDHHFNITVSKTASGSVTSQLVRLKNCSYFLIQMRHFIVILRTLWCVKKDTKTKEWFANWFLVVYFYICFYCGFARFSRHENFSFAKKMLPHNSLLTKWIIDETCVFFQTLDKVEWSDAGIYSCLAKEVGSDGLPTRQDIILDIYGKSTASSNGLLQF